MGQPAKVDVEAPVPELKPTLRTTRDTVGLRDALLARKAKKLQATRLGFLFLYMTILFGVWILALRHNRISLYELEFELRKPLGVVLKGCDLVVKRGPDARVRLKTHLSSAASSAVHKSNCRRVSHSTHWLISTQVGEHPDAQRETGKNNSNKLVTRRLRRVARSKVRPDLQAHG